MDMFAVVLLLLWTAYLELRVRVLTREVLALKGDQPNAEGA